MACPGIFEPSIPGRRLGLKRIREYNEDDCKATMVLKDALARMNTERKAG
jgi:predicted RecB family nuclease